jgi:hypothetical protein
VGNVPHVPSYLEIALIALVAAFVLAAVAPAPKKAPRLEAVGFAVLLGGAVVVALSTPVLPLLGAWYGAAAAAASAWTLILMSLWLARAPDSDSDDDAPEGGGGPPRPDLPPAPPAPDGHFGPDWSIFDSERAAWERRSRDRDPVGV